MYTCGITRLGENLKNKSDKITFTRFKLGNGENVNLTEGDIYGMVDLIQDIDQSVKIRDVRLDQRKHKATVEGVLTTDNVKQGFFWRECGLYAMDPQLGEILYNYAYSTKPDYIAASDSGMMEEILVSMIATVGSNTNVNVTIDDSLVFATKKVVDKKLYYFNNIQELQQEVSLNVGDSCTVIGDTTQYNSGFRRYKISNQDDYKEPNTVQLTNGLKAIPLPEQILLATSFEGVVPGQSKEDAPDITNALNQLFSKISAYTDKYTANQKIHFPKGVYRITGPVEITRCNIIGDNNVTFVLDGPTANLKVKPYGDNRCSYEVFIQGISIKGVNGATTGLTMYKGSQFCLRDVYIYSFAIGLELIGCDISHITRPTIQYCDVGILFNHTTAMSITHADYFANKIDNKFIEFNSGITFTDECWSENANYNFVFDSTNIRCDCTNINVIGCTFATSAENSAIVGESNILKVIGNTNTLSLQGFNFLHNRVFFNFETSRYMFNIQGSDIEPIVAMYIKGNTLYNQRYPNQKIVFTNAKNYHTTTLIYEDNITADGSFDILEGKAWLSGLDRSGTKFSYANRLRGAIVLDKVQNVDVTGLPGAMYFNQYIDKIEYIGNDRKTHHIPKKAENVPLSTATTVDLLKTDVNNLITKLIAAGVISST